MTVAPVGRLDPWRDFRREQIEAEAAEVARKKDWKLRTTWWQRHEQNRAEAIAEEKRRALLGKNPNRF
jgi:hypothetical protein